MCISDALRCQGRFTHRTDSSNDTRTERQRSGCASRALGRFTNWPLPHLERSSGECVADGTKDERDGHRLWRSMLRGGCGGVRILRKGFGLPTLQVWLHLLLPQFCLLQRLACDAHSGCPNVGTSCAALAILRCASWLDFQPLVGAALARVVVVGFS